MEGGKKIQPWASDWDEEGTLIGEGGQGTVHLMVSRVGGRKAVLKRLVERWADDEQARERLEKEAQVLSKLKKAGAKVPEVFDSSAAHSNSEPFILMEYIEGITFGELLEKRGAVSLDVALRITKAICETIRHCHLQEIGHRDLKPANIILKGSDPDQPYVIDFGISFDSQQTYLLTKDGEPFRNEFITLPENIDFGGGNRDPRSDVTAVVGILFSSVTGVYPYVLQDKDGLQPHRRIPGVLKELELTKSQRERLVWIFAKGFAYIVGQRFQSLEEFEESLRRLENSHTGESLDPLTEFDTLRTTAHMRNREVQKKALRKKYKEIKSGLTKVVKAQFANQLANRGGVFNESTKSFQRLKDTIEVDGEFLDGADLNSYDVTFELFDHLITVVLLPVSVGLELHLYLTSYASPTNDAHQFGAHLDWERAIILEDGENLTGEKESVLIDALKDRFAEEFRNFTVRLESSD